MDSERPSFAFSTRYKRVFLLLVIILCTPVLLYQCVPKFSAAADDAFIKVMEKIKGKHEPEKTEPDFCSETIGNWQCCMLYQSSLPCRNECEKIHAGRKTQEEKDLFTECKMACLAVHDATCETPENGNRMHSTLRTDLKI